MNLKERELSHQLFEQLYAKYPEIELVKITRSFGTPEATWVHIIMPQDDDLYMAVHEMAAEISTDILLDYGYHITIISASPDEKVAA